jgi:hypothetical protein
MEYVLLRQYPACGEHMETYYKSRMFAPHLPRYSELNLEVRNERIQII